MLRSTRSINLEDPNYTAETASSSSGKESIGQGGGSTPTEVPPHSSLPASNGGIQNSVTGTVYLMSEISFLQITVMTSLQPLTLDCFWIMKSGRQVSEILTLPIASSQVSLTQTMLVCSSRIRLWEQEGLIIVELALTSSNLQSNVSMWHPRIHQVKRWVEEGLAFYYHDGSRREMYKTFALF